MRLLYEIAIFQTVKSKVLISLFETGRFSVSISLRNLYNLLNSIKEIKHMSMCCWLSWFSKFKNFKFGYTSDFTINFTNGNYFYGFRFLPHQIWGSTLKGKNLLLLFAFHVLLGDKIIKKNNSPRDRGELFLSHLL